MEALRVRFVGRNVGAAGAVRAARLLHRRNPCGADRAVLEVRLDRLAREACENDVSARVRGEEDSQLLTVEWNVRDVEFVGRPGSAMIRTA